MPQKHLDNSQLTLLGGFEEAIFQVSGHQVRLRVSNIASRAGIQHLLKVAAMRPGGFQRAVGVVQSARRVDDLASRVREKLAKRLARFNI